MTKCPKFKLALEFNDDRTAEQACEAFISLLKEEADKHAKKHKDSPDAKLIEQKLEELRKSE